jgi:hypothetical protein
MGSGSLPNPGDGKVETTAGWVGAAPNLLEFVGRFLNIKKHQQDQAKQELSSTLALSQAGFPVDPKTFSKLVKKSGLPIATDEKTLSAFYGSEMENKKNQQGEGNSQGGAQQPQGPQPMKVDPNGPKSAQIIADAHNKVLSSGKPMDAGEVIATRMNYLAAKAKETQEKLQNTQAMSAQQKAENELRIEDLKSKGLNGDNEARGVLMRMGDMTVNVDFEKWSAMTDAQKKGMFDVISGNESPAERSVRSTNIAESLMSSGRLANPSMAFKAGEILASGGELPQNIRAAMKPNTFAELADQTLMAGRLVELGVPPDKIGPTMRAAAAGGLENALPKGMKPLAYKAMEQSETQSELEKLRYEKEVEIASKMAAAEGRKGIAASQQNDINTYKELVMMKNAGGKIDKDILMGAQAKAAKALGMDVSEVKDFWNFVTGGTHLEFKPNVTDESKGTIDRLTGGSSGMSSPDMNTMQKYLRGSQKPDDEGDQQ